MEVGQPAYQDYEYERNSAANISMAVEPLIGKRKTFATDQRTKQGFAELLHYLSHDGYPKVEKFTRQNMAEIELSILSSHQYTNRMISKMEALTSEVTTREKDRNNFKVQINWQFKPDNARIKLKQLYPVTVVK